MSNFSRNVALSGTMQAAIVSPPRPDWLQDIILRSSPESKGLDMWQRRYKQINWQNIARGLDKAVIAFKHNIPTLVGTWSAQLIRRDGDILDFGLVSTRVITTVGAGYIVDAFQNLVELEIMKYHGIGVTNTAEAAGDTTLASELTTEYTTNNTRATGTTTEGASGNIYRTVATNPVDASVTIVEAGIFNNATVASGVLLDRGIFGGISMVSGDSLQTTYELTVATGG